MYTVFLAIIALAGFLFSGYAGSATQQTVSIAINNEVTTELNVAPAKGDTLLLVLPSEHGIQEADTQLLELLPASGVEVWLTHLLDGYFLENSASNLERIPPRDIQLLLENIRRKTKKDIIILSAGRGTIPILRALASWPNKTLPAYISGLILMHPKLFKKTPEPGLVAELMPSVSKTNQLVYLIQPRLSPFWWNRNRVIQGLQKSGSDVFVRSLKNVRNRFFFRDDATPAELRLKAAYPKLVYNAITQLNHYPKKQRTTATHFKAASTVTSIKKQRSLSPYKGNPSPPALKLATLTNKLHDLKNDKGRVVLVNFWASWCPPCVHEMPSMQRLEDYFQQQARKQNKPGQPEPTNHQSLFRILAVNMAEDSATIQTFLNSKVSVNFEILLDSKGGALKQWKIFAFPTSFIIGKKGMIRYAIYGSINWDSTDIKNIIQRLIDE